MSKNEGAIATTVFETLKQHGCISSYAIKAEGNKLSWCDGGFERAFHELKTNPKPFGKENYGL